ncbi:hypothetical protein HELRODRAFT_86847 [Helobdella robusta]|uniref:Ubiquitin-conjugating enzyme E2 J2 n=1 Tax=Helobdella robusta TaxID=6412 RepID=T1G6I2_HELRO|nr:hypothetical protein HELRODRAFT_86847 [Helobdella robusta]ESN95317.1 hypothetical protein HELRODRAFT_86847 [Helobdella robusta]
MSNRRHTTATARLKQDYMRIKHDPVPYVFAEPLPSNILQWHYVVKGPEKSLYEGGYYHGKLVFPADFPFKPPSIYMITPNGRFSVNKRLCLSISDFHPDTWNPAWGVATILTGLLSFMLEKSPTLGSIETSDYIKKQLAWQSAEFNLKDKTFCELFPDLAEEIEVELKKREEANNKSEQTKSGKSINLTINEIASNNGRILNGIITNLAFCAGLAVFAYMVKHVISCVLEEM